MVDIIKMNRKEKVLSFMRSDGYIPMKFKELCIMLDVPAEDRDELKKILDTLVLENHIILTKKEKYALNTSSSKTVSGVLSCNKRGFFGFVVPENDRANEIFIHGVDMNGAINGDKVLVELCDKNFKGSPEGRVIRVIERGTSSIIGVIVGKEHKLYRMSCDDGRIYAKVLIEPNQLMGAKEGDRVIAEITRYEGHSLYGIVKKVLGKHDELSGLTESIIYSHNIKTEFPKSVIEQLDSVPSDIEYEDITKRRDLRDMVIFTIDGDDSKDFDDAVSIEKTDYGFLLGVHIADVTHYVKEGEPLDKEAFERGTSVYLADRVIPMLPEKLSNGICSLNPHEDRLTLSVFIRFDKDGNRIDYKIEKSVIRSCERMTYKTVAALLDGGNRELEKRYKTILPSVKLMKRLHLKLEKLRLKRGSIDFNIPEVVPILNEQGEPVGVEPEERLISHKMIESFMLAANEAVAEFACLKELPFVYRIHENLSEDKLMAVKEFLRNIGVRLVGRIDNENPLRPKQIQSVLSRTAGTPMEYMVSNFLLRSMMKAKYSPECTGHFGLAAEYYSHFTSPIRRYPDLAIHRILKESIDRKLGKRRIAKLTAFAADAAVNSSEREIDAMYCEREVNDLMKTAYMQKFIGSEYLAVISSVTAFGMFVKLENGIEGLIRVETMEADYYEFDDVLYRLIGMRTERVYCIGDKVEVVLIRADLESRQIDFVLKEDATKGNISRALQKASVTVSVDKLGRAKVKKNDKSVKKNKDKNKNKRESDEGVGKSKKKTGRSYYNTKAAKRKGGKNRGKA